MRFSDIKVGYIYNVIFDPVRDCEFDGKHLAIVLKKNNDGKTFIVMPLTSAANGSGVNKFHVRSIPCLPSSLRNNNTYAVYNQIRTVNANRFIALKEGCKVKECKLDNEVFYQLLKLGLQEIVYSIPQDDRITIWKNLYENENVIKAKDIAYNIKAQASNLSDEERNYELLKIGDLIHGIEYSLEKKYADDKIDSIFEEAKKLKMS